MFYWRTCFTEVNILWEHMSYGITDLTGTCLARGHALSYRMTSLTGILQEDMSYE